MPELRLSLFLGLFCGMGKTTYELLSNALRLDERLSSLRALVGRTRRWDTPYVRLWFAVPLFFLPNAGTALVCNLRTRTLSVQDKAQNVRDNRKNKNSEIERARFEQRLPCTGCWQMLVPCPNRKTSGANIQNTDSFMQKRAVILERILASTSFKQGAIVKRQSTRVPKNRKASSSPRWYRQQFRCRT